MSLCHSANHISCGGILCLEGFARNAVHEFIVDEELHEIEYNRVITMGVVYAMGVANMMGVVNVRGVTNKWVRLICEA